MRRILPLSLAGTLLALIPTIGHAQTNSTWNGTIGNWSDFTRWSTNPIFPNNGQPNAGDLYNAIVSSGTVTLDQDIVIQGLTLSGGTVNGSNNLTLNAASSWSGGFMTGTGTTTFNGPLLINTDINIFSVGRNVINNGTTTWTGSLFINNSSGTWTNQNGSVFDIQNDQTWFGSAVFSNQAGATLQKSAGTGTSSLQMNVNNSGSVVVNTGTLEFNSGSSSGSGTFTVASGAKLSLKNYTLAAGTSISGAGGLTITSSTINGLYSATGPVAITSGTTSFNTPATFGSLTLAGTLAGTGNITVDGPTIWNGTGFMEGTGSTTFNGPVSINSTSIFSIHRNIINNGTTTWTGDNFINNSVCNWFNQSGSVFDIQNNQTMFSTAAGFFNQAGATFRKSAGSGVSNINWVFTNSGTIEAQSGLIAFKGGFFQDGGVIILNGGGIVNINPLGFSGGALVGNGSLGAATFGNATIAPGFSAGTLSFDGNLLLSATSTLNFELGTLSDLINVNGNLTLDGTLNLAALSGFGAGTFTIIDYSGSLTDNGLTFGSTPDGFEYQLILDSDNTQIDVLVTATAVPEPSVIILGTTTLLGGGVCVWGQRKLKRRKHHNRG